MSEYLQRKHRVWAEIDLDRLVENYQTAKGLSRNGRVMPVLKADAYGHGAVRCASALRRAGADFFAVATPEEALQLRRHGIDCELLLLGTAPASQISPLARAGITLCVPDSGTARLYRETRERLRVHIKIDTGMNLLGFDCGNAAQNVLEIAGDMKVTGLFTHFAAADNPSEDAFTGEQLKLFMRVCSELSEKGLDLPVRHAANSAALLAHPDTHLDITRPGLMLYGYSPFTGSGDAAPNPVLSLYSSITQCRAIPEGMTANYGRTWKARRNSVVATVPVGYADMPSWGMMEPDTAFMLVRGQKAPFVGRVCMDYCILDVTDIPGAAQGDLVTILNDEITVTDHARLLNTVTWEILFSIGRRVPRIYRQAGGIIGEDNDLDKL